MGIFDHVKNPRGLYAASNFVDAFSNAGVQMKMAEHLLLKVISDSDGEAKKRYKAAHKRLVRARRNWNRIEHFRDKDQ